MFVQFVGVISLYYYIINKLLFILGYGLLPTINLTCLECEGPRCDYSTTDK